MYPATFSFTVAVLPVLLLCYYVIPAKAKNLFLLLCSLLLKLILNLLDFCSTLTDNYAWLSGVNSNLNAVRCSLDLDLRNTCSI